MCPSYVLVLLRIITHHVIISFIFFPTFFSLLRHDWSRGKMPTQCSLLWNFNGLLSLKLAERITSTTCCFVHPHPSVSTCYLMGAFPTQDWLSWRKLAMLKGSLETTVLFCFICQFCHNRRKLNKVAVFK